MEARRAAFLLGTDSEAAAGGLLREVFVEVFVGFLESGAVKPLGQNGSPTNDVSPRSQFFGVAFQHIRSYIKS